MVPLVLGVLHVLLVWMCIPWTPLIPFQLVVAQLILSFAAILSSPSTNWGFFLVICTFLCYAKEIPKSQCSHLKRMKGALANNQWFCSWITLWNLRRFWRIRSKLWCDLWTLTCSPKQFSCFNNHLLMATTFVKLEKKQKALEKKKKFLY